MDQTSTVSWQIGGQWKSILPGDATAWFASLVTQSHLGEQSWTYHQDGAPTDKSKQSRQWCRARTPLHPS